MPAIISDIYAKLDKLGSVPEMLQKLDVLPSIDSRMAALENRFSAVENEIVNIKGELSYINGRISGSETISSQLHERLVNLEIEKDKMCIENFELREKVIDMQSRSMRENLIFAGLAETQPEKVKGADNIHTERVLQNFLRETLGFQEEIKFHVVHRLRPRKDNKPRSIIAKFERRKDRDMVLQKASTVLKNTDFSVFEQLPRGIVERRNELWPLFKEQQRLGKNVKFKGDILVVDGWPVHPNRAPRKRQTRRNPEHAHASHPYHMNYTAPAGPSYADTVRGAENRDAQRDTR